jgi:hypothetical protein
VYPALPRTVRSDVYHGDNVSGAENQQERLIRLGWVTGFVDGEGCFSIGFVRQPSRGNRKGYKAGLVSSDRHLTREGLIEIAEIAETMNHRKSRQELIRILRGHTPDIRDTG